jgi:tetratricopeptide (TPR) repeat protein
MPAVTVMRGHAEGVCNMRAPRAGRRRLRVAKAIDELLSAALSGDAQAAQELGSRQYAPGDLEQVLSWGERAKADGNTDAVGMVAAILEQMGHGREARQWYTMGATRGHAPSMNGLGLLLWQVGDYRLAERWLRRGAKAGNLWAVTNLGRLLQQNGTWDEAAAMYAFAAESNWEPARRALYQLEHDRPALAYWEALEFTTFGWRQRHDTPTFRQWHIGTESLTVRFFPSTPVKTMRSQIPDRLFFSADGLALDMDEAQSLMGDVHPVSQERFSVEGAFGVSTVLVEPEQFVRAAEVVAFADFHWLLSVNLPAETTDDTVLERARELESALRRSLRFRQSMDGLAPFNEGVLDG